MDGTPNAFATVVLFSWAPVVLCLFAVLRPRRAVIAAFLGAWLFLPVLGFPFQGIPDYTKMSATCLGVLLGLALFDFDRLASFRPRWLDVPMIVWCLCPFATSVSNGYGAYDGASGVLSHFITWGLPYFIGRMYFTSLASLKELAVGVLIGGLIYVPLCLFEIRMSPQLHRMFYGCHQHSFLQHMRYGGYRPMVFMQHGLMVGLWMAMASLIGLWFWRSGVIKQIMGFPVSWFVGALFLTTVLCKSIGALLLLAAGVGAFFALRQFRTVIPIICLAALPPAYMALRETGILTRGFMVQLASEVVDQERVISYESRLGQEDAFSVHAWKKPWFGHGGQGMYPTDEEGKRVRAARVADSLWIQALVMRGLAGLAALTAALLMPVVLLLKRCRATLWTRPEFAPAGALCLILALYMVDNMANSMENPVFILVAGSLAGWLVAVSQPRPAAVPNRVSWQPVTDFRRMIHQTAN